MVNSPYYILKAKANINISKEKKLRIKSENVKKKVASKDRNNIRERNKSS